MQSDDKVQISCPNCGASVSGLRKQFESWICPKCKIELEGDHDTEKEAFLIGTNLLGRTISIIGWLSVIGGILIIVGGVAIGREIREEAIRPIVAMYSFVVGAASVLCGCVEVYLGKSIKQGSKLFCRIATDIARIRYAETKE